MVYKWYILPTGGLYATYHLLGEPETTIDVVFRLLSFSSLSTFKQWGGFFGAVLGGGCGFLRFLEQVG